MPIHYDYVPWFRYSFPDAEREFAETLQNSLRSLTRYTDEFQATVALFEFGEEQIASRKKKRVDIRINHEPNRELEAEIDTLYAWKRIAARNGVLSIFHFSKAMESVRVCLRSCPSILAHVNSKDLKTTGRAFRKHFPSFESLRHAVAHTAENHSTPTKRAENQFSGSFLGLGMDLSENTRISITDGLLNQTFTSTYAGAIVSYDVTVETLQILKEIEASFYDAFRNAERALLEEEFARSKAE